MRKTTAPAPAGSRNPPSSQEIRLRNNQVKSHGRPTRETAKQHLIAAELPAAFIEEHGSVVVENHLNMIRPLNGAPRVTPAALSVLLNSDVVDQVFRCINGSVAVSAYELEALPMPPPEGMKEVERLVRERANREILEREVERLYFNGTG